LGAKLWVVDRLSPACIPRVAARIEYDDVEIAERGGKCRLPIVRVALIDRTGEE